MSIATMEPAPACAPMSDAVKIEFEMTGPGADTYTMDFSLCTSTTTSCCAGGRRKN
ncbi:hypothetical protein QE412_000660 [Microbacterium trichothecenolyticum]|uniref:Uncharacterized protein n=1 Tax=Microbacterium trichothecenolyticum TaxID=69370 RepID=A0ABU0TT30_MICTR|nr:hypothetical protein [Microbacterium trichothecenolyticum]